jgi:glycine/D-amino acid oxidase-like deaminating enzyme
MVLATQMLQSGIATPGFDPTAFATGRRDAWSAIGNAMCEACNSEAEEQRFTRAYAEALERLGHLLVVLAEPVQEAIDEVQQAGTAAPAGDG